MLQAEQSMLGLDFETVQHGVSKLTSLISFFDFHLLELTKKLEILKL